MNRWRQVPGYPDDVPRDKEYIDKDIIDNDPTLKMKHQAISTPVEIRERIEVLTSEATSIRKCIICSLTDDGCTLSDNEFHRLYKRSIRARKELAKLNAKI